MSLDTLYGAGSAAKFAELTNIESIFPKVKATILEAEGVGSVYTETVWKSAKEQVARCCIQFFPTYAEYGCLQVVAADRGKGLYERVLTTNYEWLNGLGVGAMVCQPSSPRSEWLLALGGFVPLTLQGVEWFGTQIGPSSRVAEYIAWANQGKPEASQPVWSKELHAHAVPGEQVY